MIIPLLCQHGLFIHTGVSKNANVSKGTISYLLWYKQPFIKNFSLENFFSEKHRGGGWVNSEIVIQVHGMKNAIIQVKYFLNGSMLDMLFYCHIITYWEKVTP